MKFIIGFVFGVILTLFLIEMTTVKVLETNTGKQHYVVVKYIPDSWKSVIQNYFQKK